MKCSPAPLLISAAPALFVIMWAAGFVVARLSAPHADPLSFLSLRFAIAYMLFNETLNVVHTVGMAVCAAAVLIVTRKPARPA